ncbi:MAG: peptidoglycan bridge formation glycyltransferase FemA/FemB family protein [Patescibacteria group bacterium]|nr:peptidoglycan bridge formation glycyltransferase FemA/FemB family protein [Patescibacteria group bacterium]
MRVVEVSRAELNSFTASQKRSQFLQSWEWGEFQERTGKKVIRLGFEDDDKLFFAFTLIKNNLPLGMNYFYSPRVGVESLNKEQVELVFKEIKKIAKKEKILFFRLDLNKNLKFKILNFKFKKTIHVQPEKTLILNISRSGEELLQSMHKKTRYNIRLAEKKGVTVRQASEADFNVWWNIMKETKERDNFRLYSKEHYKKMLKINIIKLYIAEFQEKIIAGNIIASFGDMATYVHGASSNKYRNVMAPYLLQWEAIKIAKEQGCKCYDFYGIDEDKWPGVTRFKQGFSGEEIIYPGTFDLIYYDFYYNLYQLLRKIRRMV